MSRTDNLSGEAGNRGPEVRSDCWIRISFGEEPGIRLESKVEALYGESIRSLISDGLEILGLSGVHIEVEDQGALPWVISARLEAAARSVQKNQDTSLLPERKVTARTPIADRLRRSRLYLPGNTPRFMLNAGFHHPDGVILDLEDSVAPTRKDEARLLVRNALRCHDFGSSEVMVRINQLPLGLDDLATIVPEGPEMILIPKVESPEQVREVDRICREVAAETGISPPLLMPIIESGRGAWFSYDIADATPQVAALTIGLEDYTADIGVERTGEGWESFWARSQVVNAACAAGIQPIDTVYSDVADMEGLRSSVAEARALGFVGKGCIHPRQIQPIHEAFAPAPSEIEKSTRIVLAYEEARERGEGVVALGSKMIDPPVVARALRTVKMAVTLDLLPENWRNCRQEEKEGTPDA